MQFIPSRELRINPAKVWEVLKEKKEIIITVNGKPIAILTDVTPENLEEVIQSIRKARAERALSMIRKRSMETGKDKITSKEIEKEVQAVRRKFKN